MNDLMALRPWTLFMPGGPGAPLEKIEIVFGFAGKKSRAAAQRHFRRPRKEPHSPGALPGSRRGRNRLRYYNSYFETLSIFFTKFGEQFVT
jgi:hypothetical protein